MLAREEMLMIARLLTLLLSLMTGYAAFGQAGWYGPVTVRPKAGSLAPELVFEKTVSSPGAGSWSETRFAGQVTILGFFPDTTDNLEAVTAWNAMVDRFAGKPVQFVWITGEKDDVLVPWVAQHPIKGWVLEDSAGKTGNAYGMEIPANVIVGVDGKIVGFYRGLAQTPELIRAVQEGRATTKRPTKATLKAFQQSKRVLLDAEPRRMPKVEDHRPGFAPSSALHVSSAVGEQQVISSAEDFLSLQGYTVKEAIEELYGFTPARLRMPSTLDSKERYDFAMVLPGRESRETMRERMRVGLLEHFHATAARESRSVEVYVITAVAGRRPPTPDAGHGSGGFAFELESIESPGETDETKPVSLDAVRGVSSEGTMEEFCHQLEAELDRPVINETGLHGEFKIKIDAGDVDRNDFLKRLRNEAGLVMAPAELAVEMLVIAGSAP